jgi:hypothetical protein
MTIHRLRRDLARLRESLPARAPEFPRLSTVERAQALCNLFQHCPALAPEGFDPVEQLARVEGDGIEVEAAAKDIIETLKQWRKREAR